MQKGGGGRYVSASRSQYLAIHPGHIGSSGLYWYRRWLEISIPGGRGGGEGGGGALLTAELLLLLVLALAGAEQGRCWQQGPIRATRRRAPATSRLHCTERRFRVSPLWARERPPGSRLSRRPRPPSPPRGARRGAALKVVPPLAAPGKRRLDMYCPVFFTWDAW